MKTQPLTQLRPAVEHFRVALGPLARTVDAATNRWRRTPEERRTLRKAAEEATFDVKRAALGVLSAQVETEIAYRIGWLPPGLRILRGECRNCLDVCDSLLVEIQRRRYYPSIREDSARYLLVSFMKFADRMEEYVSRSEVELQTQRERNAAGEERLRGEDR